MFLLDITVEDINLNSAWEDFWFLIQVCARFRHSLWNYLASNTECVICTIFNNGIESLASANSLMIVGYLSDYNHYIWVDLCLKVMLYRQRRCKTRSIIEWCIKDVEHDSIRHISNSVDHNEWGFWFRPFHEHNGEKDPESGVIKLCIICEETRSRELCYNLLALWPIVFWFMKIFILWLQP